MRPDILVVGGGPAGLASAIAAAQKGFRVAVVDSRKPPINKPCGEGLLPEAVESLRLLGVHFPADVGQTFEGFRFVDDERSASAWIPQGRAVALRRPILHRMLIERAEECGIDLHWGARVSDFESGGVRVDGNPARYRWLVGADGQNSVVRSFARLDPRWTSTSRFGFRRHYAMAPWTGLVEVHWARRSQMIVAPTGADEVCVSMFADDSRARIGGTLDRFPGLAERLRRAEPVTSEAGAMIKFRRARAAVRGDVALVGDASFTVDAVSGQGLSLAFRQAHLLADALACENLARYEAAHRRLSVAAMRVTHLLMAMNDSVWLRRKVLRLFAGHPNLFANMISVHTQPSPEPLKAGEIMNLTWRVLRA